MAAIIKVLDQPRGLSIHVSEPPRLGRMLLGLVLGGAFTYFFVRNTGSKPLQIILGAVIILVVLKDALSYLRGTSVTLRVGNLDFVSSGHAPGGYEQSIVSRADISNLEFRKASGGGDDKEHPQGLYADCGDSIWNTATCLLPHIDQAQAEEVMQAIYRRYPNTGTLGPASNAYKSDLILLNLNKPRNS